MKKVILCFPLCMLLFLSVSLYGQLLPNYYPVLESNKGVGNKQLNYHLYSITSGTAFPADSIGFNTYVKSGVVQKFGATSLAVEKGTINTTASTQYNLLNWNNYTQLQNATFGGVTPFSGFGDYFSLVANGYFIPKETGTYTFTAESDDANELVINNKVVVAQYGGHGASAIGTHTGTVALIAGLKYPFRVRMQETQVGEALNVFWQKPSEVSSGSWYQDVEELSSVNVINNGLVHKLDFNNAYTYPLTGTKAYDLVNNQNGTISGAVYKDTVKGLPNSALYFNSNASNVDFGTNPTNFPTGDITVNVWVNFQDFNSPASTYVWNIFMTKWFLGAAGGTPDMHYCVKYNGTNFYQNLYTTGNNDMYGTTIITKYNWYNLGFTLTNGGNLQFYINGLPDGPAISGVSRTYNTNSNYFLGDPRTGALGLIGYISAANIYNRALSATEMLSNFNAEKNRYGLMFSPTDASYWYATSVYNNNAFGYWDGTSGCYTPWIDSQQAWSPLSNGLTDYVYIKLENTRYVKGIVSQGRANQAQWVTQAKVEYSIDGSTWTLINTYNMNTDQNTKVYNYFSAPVYARYIKVTPTANNGFSSMRLGVMY